MTRIKMFLCSAKFFIRRFPTQFIGCMVGVEDQLHSSNSLITFTSVPPSSLPRGSYPYTAARITASPTPTVPFALCSSKSWGLKSMGPIVFRECPNLLTLLGQKFCKLSSKSFPCHGLITARTLVSSFSSASSPTSGWLIILTSSRNNRSVAARNRRAVNHLCCIYLLML